jgi:hypothetical protein
MDQWTPQAVLEFVRGLLGLGWWVIAVAFVWTILYRWGYPWRWSRRNDGHFTPAALEPGEVLGVRSGRDRR